MPELDDHQLDRAIRDLVGRAVADSPAPPSIDASTRPPVRLDAPQPGDHRRWMATGIAGLTVAAAVVALVFVTRPADTAEAPAPATVPTTDAGTTPGTTLPASTGEVPNTAVTTMPATVPATVPATPQATAVPMTTLPATTVPVTVPPIAPPVALVTAGPDGVTVTGTDGVERTGFTDPAYSAQLVPDGRVFVQLASESAPAVVEVGTDGSYHEAPMPAGVDHPFLHDAAVVDGEVVLLVEDRSTGCTDPTTCLGSIWAVRPDSGGADKIDEMVVWESGWSGLSLATTGLVVGTTNAEATHQPYSIVLPGAAATPVDFSRYGLEDSYGDCFDRCPNGFTVDSTGRYLAWIAPDATTAAVVVADLTTDVMGEAPFAGALLRMPSTLDVAGVVVGADHGLSGRAVINREPANPRSPLLLELDGSLPPAQGPGGSLITFGL